jgi:hypothetical protein
MFIVVHTSLSQKLSRRKLMDFYWSCVNCGLIEVISKYIQLQVMLPCSAEFHMNNETSFGGKGR